MITARSDGQPGHESKNISHLYKRPASALRHTHASISSTQNIKPTNIFFIWFIAMPYYPLPDPEDPDWAEIMYEMFPEARPAPPEDYYVVDLTRKGCGIRGY